MSQTSSFLQPVQHTAPSRSGRGIHPAWVLLCLVATLLGLISLRYLLPQTPLAIHNSNFTIRRPWLVVHATSASIALIIGPWQFLKRLQTSAKRWHRKIGWVYMVSVLIGWVSSIPVALHAPSGVPARAGYVALGAAWIVTSSLGLQTAIRRRYDAHRSWMIRSYALSGAAITLRIVLPICLFSGVPFRYAEPVSVWGSVVVNLCLAQLLIRKWQSSQGAAVKSLRLAAVYEEPASLGMPGR